MTASNKQAASLRLRAAVAAAHRRGWATADLGFRHGVREARDAGLGHRIAMHQPASREVGQRARFYFVAPGRAAQTLNHSSDAQFNLRAPEAQRV
jgi:hypothetical protein